MEVVGALEVLNAMIYARNLFASLPELPLFPSPSPLLILEKNSKIHYPREFHPALHVHPRYIQSSNSGLPTIHSLAINQFGNSTKQSYIVSPLYFPPSPGRQDDVDLPGRGIYYDVTKLHIHIHE